MRRETSGLNACNPELFGQKKNWWKFFWKIPFFLWAIYFRNISFIYNKKKLFFITQIFDNFFPGLNSGILFVQTNKQKRNQIKRWKHLFFTPTIFSHPLLDNVCSNTPMTIDDNNNLVQTNKHLEQTHTRDTIDFGSKWKKKFDSMTQWSCWSNNKKPSSKTRILFSFRCYQRFFFVAAMNEKKRGVNYSFFHRVFVNVIIWIFITHKQTNNHNNDRMEKTLSPVCLAVRKVFICSTQWWQQIQQIFTSNTIEW